MNELAIRTAIFSDDQVEIAKDALIRALSAKKTARRRSGDGSIQYLEVDDTAMQVVAATKVIEFGRGKPISMNLNADLTPKDAEKDGQAFMKSVLGDPEARLALRETLSKVLDVADRVKPIEVKATPALPEGGKPSA